MNPFDNLQKLGFNVVTQVMGYDATWQPQDGPIQSARVLFKDPSEINELAGMEFNPNGFMMEYQEGYFTGLLESCRKGNVEYVTVNDQQYWVKDVKRYYDGKTIRARLERKS